MATAFRSSLINRAIASLFNGVSQQPASLRLTSQGELQENAYPNLVDGLSKRPFSKHVADLSTSTDEDRFVHWIDRDLQEQYVVVIEDGDLKVYDLEGDEKTVNFATDSKDYLDVPNDEAARESFSVVTIADYSFIVNKTITTAMDSGTISGSLDGTVQTFAELPTGSTGEIYRITGDPTNSFDNYYVEKLSNGTWAETAKPGETFSFDQTTMPHQLVRQANGEFNFGPATWRDRAVGEKSTNPDPSFIGQKIQDVFLYRNRLGFLAGENVTLSAIPASDLSFYRDSMVALTDADPIDTAASDEEVALLKHAVPFNRSLLLFSEKAQFQMGAEGTLTPSNASIDVTTRFASSKFVKPTGAGPNVYFAVPRGKHTSFREYYVEDQVLTNDAADVTAHVPNYVPQNVFQIVTSTNEDVLFALTLEERNVMYVYKYFWQGDEKVQSAWGKWIFHDDDVLLGAAMYETKLYMLVKRSDGTFLDVLDVKDDTPDTGLEHQVLLDRRVEISGTYDSGNNETSFELPYEITGDSPQTELVSPVGQKLALKSETSESGVTTVVVKGDRSEGTYFAGVPYTFRYRFSEQFVKDSNKNVVRDGRLQLKSWEVSYVDTAFFRAEVTPKARQTYKYPFNTLILGDDLSKIGSISPRTGSFSFPVQSDSRKVTVELVNDQPLPCTFQSAEWRALFSVRSARR